MPGSVTNTVAPEVINLCRERWRIECLFLDRKTLRFGMGMREMAAAAGPHARTAGPHAPILWTVAAR